MLYAIKSRYTGAAIVTVEIECRDTASEGVQLGLAVKAAYIRGANLEGANLAGANLAGAYLRSAYLRGTYLEGAHLRSAHLRGADLKGAYLEGAYIEGAYLEGANLAGAYLRGTLIADIGQRSDGYQFFIQQRDDGPWIIAGCRYFTLADARKHWVKARGGTPLGDETMMMLDHAERIARHRGWLAVAEVEAV